MQDRVPLPEPLTGERPVRFEHQHWQRLARGEGELDIGYDPIEDRERFSVDENGIVVIPKGMRIE